MDGNLTQLTVDNNSENPYSDQVTLRIKHFKSKSERYLSSQSAEAAGMKERETETESSQEKNVKEETMKMKNAIWEKTGDVYVICDCISNWRSDNP